MSLFAQARLISHFEFDAFSKLRESYENYETYPEVELIDNL